MVRHTDIEWHNGGSGKQRQLFASPVVIAVDAVFIIPEVTVYRIATGTGFLAEQCFCLFLAFQRRMLAMALSSLNRKAFRSMGMNWVVRMLARRPVSRSQREE